MDVFAKVLCTMVMMHGSMSTFEHHADLLRSTKVNKVYENLIDTKQFKQDMLRGQPFKILDFVELKHPKKTFY